MFDCYYIGYINYNNYKFIKKKNIENFEIINTEDFFREELHIPYHDKIRNDDSIFVSIASYRDTECMKTLTDLFDKADKPDNIYVGICHQNKNKNEYCIPNNFKHMDHIRFKDYDYKEALGPTFARYICSHLWKGEQYFMQIDSHSRFIKGWDTKIKNMYKQCESKKSILTHYPPSHSQYEQILEKKVKPSHTCKAHFENKFHIISGAVGKKILKINHLLHHMFLLDYYLVMLNFYMKYRLILIYHICFKEKKFYYQQDYGQMVGIYIIYLNL